MVFYHMHFSQITLKPSDMFTRFTCFFVFVFLKIHKIRFYLQNLVSSLQTSENRAAGRHCARKVPFIPTLTDALSEDIAKHNVMIRNDWLAFCHHTIYLPLIYYLRNLICMIIADRSHIGSTKHHFPICWASFFVRTIPIIYSWSTLA